MPSLEERLKQQARLLGFELVGIAPAAEADGFARLQDWLHRGYAGEMAYMHRHGDARRHPASILPEVRSVVMLGMNYLPAADAQACRSRDDRSHRPRPEFGGRVARYARGADYHEVLRQRLHSLLDWLQQDLPGCRGRGVVDTAPLLERDFARRAGLGWFGKNTMLINSRLGSYFFLAALLVDKEMQPDPPATSSHCGTCTACLDRCPTDAFVNPGVLDSRRCISYLTIELKTAIPGDLRAAMGDWVFGCDICQEVCPWNRKAPTGGEPAFGPRPDLDTLDLIEVLGLSETAFRERFRDTALWRTKRRGLLRNAAIVLGNQGDARAIPALQKALEDEEPLVREAAQWAIEQIDSRERLAQAPASNSSPEANLVFPADGSTMR